jgi:dihydrolipoamide dehydrogenase
MPQLLPGEDKDVARKLEGIFKKRGIRISTDTDANTVNLNDYELVLLCIGRLPNVEGLDLNRLGMKLEKNKIVIDEYLTTSIPNIYAAGDCTGKIMLAHFAAYQGRIAAENIVHPHSLKKADNANVPNCIFTDPEIASVGLDEEEARAQGLDIKVNKFDFLGCGMAHILDETGGFIKIISDKKSVEVLGAAIIGPRACELIATLTLAISARIKVSQIQDTIFAHPTISESIGEAFKANYGL